VIAMLVADDERRSVLTATENGYGKRTPLIEHTRHGRGTKGMIAIQSSERNGRMVAAILVEEGDEIMLITTGGVLVRTRVDEIREMGRATQGVTLIGVEEGDTLSRVQRVVGSDSPEVLAAVGESAEGDATEASDGPEAAEDSPSGDDAAAEGEAAEE
jgi:DNA gyrase, A subunit